MELLTRDEIVRLSPPERLALIAQLWDSLAENQLPLSQAQQAELERRLASLDRDPQTRGYLGRAESRAREALPIVFAVVFTQAAREELIDAQIDMKA